MNNPKYLYRYISVSKEKYYKNIFKKHQLFFTSPEKFNDPFDCKTNLSYRNCSDYDLKIFFREFIEKSFKGITNSQLKSKVSKFLNEYKKDPENIINSLNQKLIEIIKEDSYPLGVLCLSKIPDDILMWSHYANCHTGIVLQFRKAGLKERFSFCEHINYCKDLPTVSDWNKSNLSNLHQLFLLRKSRHWGYEKEWRVITVPQDRHDKPGNRNFDFPKDILTGVIIGCQISNDQEEEINELIRNHCPQVVVYYAKKDTKSYKIIIEPQLPT